MTVIERVDDLCSDAVVFRCNGCVEARISPRLLRSESDWWALIAERVVPLVWFCMPVHDPPGRA